MFSLLKKLSIALFVLIVIIFAILIANALREPSAQIDVPPISVSLKNNDLANVLAKAIQIPTISESIQNPDTLQHFANFRQLIRQAFPLAHQALQVELVNNHSLLYTWQGQNSALKPALFLGHYDVVQVDPHTTNDWSHPPFTGAIVDNYIWGRGALDDKAAVIALLNSVEQLLQQNHQPQRTILIAIGHDEEIGGTEGAEKIAAILAGRGIRPEMIFDEGMPITDGIIVGAKQPVAMIGIAEKGYLNLELIVNTEGGHSSSPPNETAVGILAKAITQIEQNPMALHMDGVMSQTFDAIAPDMGFVQKVVLGNRWLLESLVAEQLAKKPSTNASIRTTAAPTMISGSPQANVLPTTARATINIRILPGDTVLSSIDFIRNVINDARVELQINGQPVEPSRISSREGAGYKIIETTLRELFPDVLVAPAQMIASTDSKHYASLADNVYRFRPFWIKQEDVSRFHGVNERISIENFNNVAKFYLRLIENSSK